MMDKENLKFYGIYLGFFIIILLVVFPINSNKIPMALQEKGGWEYQWFCSEYKFFEQKDADKGYNCLLEECILRSDEPKIESCICVLNNLTINRICTRELYLREYPYRDYMPNFPEDSLTSNLSEYNIGGEEDE